MSTSSRPPIRFGYKVAVITALGFAVFAGWPYLSRATERLTKGQPVDLPMLVKEVQRETKGGANRGGPNKGGPGGPNKEWKMNGPGGFEAKSVLAMADGTIMVGGQTGLMEYRGSELAPVANYEGDEVRGLALGNDGVLWAAAKDGLWKRVGTEWKQVKDGDFWSVSFTPDGTLLLAGKTGVLRSKDGAKWEPLQGIEASAKGHEEHGGHGRMKEKKEHGPGRKDGDREDGDKKGKAIES